jgi:hypothetical protein
MTCVRGSFIPCYTTWKVDEPEALAAPMLPQELRPILGRDDPTIDAIVDTMTEEELLRGLQKQSPEDPTLNPRHNLDSYNDRDSRER